MTFNDLYSINITQDGVYEIHISCTVANNGVNLQMYRARGGTSSLVSFGSASQTSNVCSAHHIDSHLAGDVLIFATDIATTVSNPTATFLFLPDNTEVQ